MQYRIAFMDALRRVTGEDLSRDFEPQMRGEYALAGVIGEHPGGYAETQQSVLWNPSYGQLDYVSPVLLALAREYRRPVYQRLALWDRGLGAVQRTRYRTPNGVGLDFAWGGYAYAWYDPTVEPQVEQDLPLSFQFPSVNQSYARASYEPGALAFGLNLGRLAAHAGEETVLVEMMDPYKPPQATTISRFEETGAQCRIECRGGEDSPFAAQTVTLSRPGSLSITREGAKPADFWCHGTPVRDGNRLTWSDGATLEVTQGEIEAFVPEGYKEELIVGMGLLRCDDPMPRTYPSIRLTPTGGELSLTVHAP
jgi:hypothetical protein